MDRHNGHDELPVAVIGAGPVGLAAAAHLHARGLRPLVLEAGADVGAGVTSWGHVQAFSPWEMNTDAVAVDLLERSGWVHPDPGGHPTGHELVERYLRPLARTPQLRPHVHVARRVLAVSRLGLDKLRTEGRDETPFELVAAGPGGVERHLARAVLDASGTLQTPNPLGAAGLPAAGEEQLGDRIAHGHPDVLGVDRALYAGQRVLVVGTGHSALGALLDLLALREEHPDTQVLWAVRRTELGDLFAGGGDQLPRRGRLALEVGRRFDELRVYAGFAARELADTPEGIVAGDGTRSLPPVDRIVAATGYRPDTSLLRELRIRLDPWVESPPALAPMIDPNLHSCGTVRPHGVEELGHPERDAFLVGMKSYGRAPTFLMKTGYEQVRSVTAALAGDWKAARTIELDLPETGVCSAPPLAVGAAAGAGCC